MQLMTIMQLYKTSVYIYIWPDCRILQLYTYIKVFIISFIHWTWLGYTIYTCRVWDEHICIVMWIYKVGDTFICVGDIACSVCVILKMAIIFKELAAAQLHTYKFWYVVFLISMDSKAHYLYSIGLPTVHGHWLGVDSFFSRLFRVCTKTSLSWPACMLHINLQLRIQYLVCMLM